ncbi:hypothetical protein [uncultured Flavobacterium sp.]|uniref:hypothetical protein n=1 Tax=uncultured Flavobacterium sp. TaxID=165435 RepID=UPI0030ECF550|tara:strand:+ start:1861 stop:2268 length:408 start_codon:yes stop_codon:yes gene_type:complete
MKNLIIILFSLIVFSCSSNKQILSPNIEFIIFDSVTKKPLSSVALFTNDSKGTSENLILYSEKSNAEGLIYFKEKYIYLKGNIRNFTPIPNTKFYFKKEGYEDVEIEFFKYFNVTEQSDLQKKYVSDSIFMKLKE